MTDPRRLDYIPADPGVRDVIESIEYLNPQDLTALHLHLWREMNLRVCEALGIDFTHAVDCDQCWETCATMTEDCLDGSCTLEDVAAFVEPTDDTRLRLYREEGL